MFAMDIAAALADDAETLALIHDRELTAAFIEELSAIGFPHNLALLPADARAQETWRFMAAALADLTARLDATEIDHLAADFAAIYLVSSYGASPCESTWIDEDHLLCQDTMFQLRKIYRAAGLAAADWRRRPDDHLVLQLAYLAHAMRHAGSNDDDWRAIARMMDEHLLRWLPDFCQRIATRCATPFYAGLAMVTNEWAEGLRNLLAAQLGEPRPSREEIELRLKPPPVVHTPPVAFVPGIGPAI
jgi:TorA maturation chaperone TorD